MQEPKPFIDVPTSPWAIFAAILTGLLIVADHLGLVRVAVNLLAK